MPIEPQLTEARVAELLAPYLAEHAPAHDLYAKVCTYIDLLLRWNARTNLTAVRDPKQLVQRQVGESLFAAALVAERDRVLDFGSGAGFPGIPLQLVRPLASVTLAESQGKKASFLREAVRTLGLPCSVWAGRVEDLPAEQTFDVVTLRAVDHAHAMDKIAADRVGVGGSMLRFAAGGEQLGLDGWTISDTFMLPLSQGKLLRLQRT